MRRYKHTERAVFARKPIDDAPEAFYSEPLSLKEVVYLDGQKAVLHRSRMNPSLGRNFEAMDPLEWPARLADHIHDPGKHRTLFYSYYANRVRGGRAAEEPGRQKHEEEQPKKRRCSPSWARLIIGGVLASGLGFEQAPRVE